jgi:hypothetical protein
MASEGGVISTSPVASAGSAKVPVRPDAVADLHRRGPARDAEDPVVAVPGRGASVGLLAVGHVASVDEDHQRRRGLRRIATRTAHAQREASFGRDGRRRARRVEGDGAPRRGLGQRHGVRDPIGQDHPQRARPVRHAEEPVVALPARAASVGRRDHGGVDGADEEVRARDRAPHAHPHGRRRRGRGNVHHDLARPRRERGDHQRELTPVGVAHRERAHRGGEPQEPVVALPARGVTAFEARARGVEALGRAQRRRGEPVRGARHPAHPHADHRGRPLLARRRIAHVGEVEDVAGVGEREVASGAAATGERDHAEPPKTRAPCPSRSTTVTGCSPTRAPSMVDSAHTGAPEG